MGTTSDQPGILHRAIAVVCLAVVVFLGAAGASADLHGAVHAAQPASADDHGCAVELFTQNATQPFGPPQLAALPGVIDTAYERTAEPAVPTKPAGTHPPGRGPPLE